MVKLGCCGRQGVWNRFSGHFMPHGRRLLHASRADVMKPSVHAACCCAGQGLRAMSGLPADGNPTGVARTHVHLEGTSPDASGNATATANASDSKDGSKSANATTHVVTSGHVKGSASGDASAGGVERNEDGSLANAARPRNGSIAVAGTVVDSTDTGSGGGGNTTGYSYAAGNTDTDGAVISMTMSNSTVDGKAMTQSQGTAAAGTLLQTASNHVCTRLHTTCCGHPKHHCTMHMCAVCCSGLHDLRVAAIDCQERHATD
jgi:hypothetical protein